MVECEIVKLYKYTVTYNHGEKDEYDVILVSDNMKNLVELIVDREMIDSMKDANKWFEISDFMWVSRKDEKWYHLFDIDEQDLAVKFGYDVQEQYWKCLFKNDCPESVKDINEIMDKFENFINKLHPNDEWAKTFAAGDVLGKSLYESEYVQTALREENHKMNMHKLEELDAGIVAIESIMKGE